MGSPRLESLRAALTAMPPGTLVPRDWVLEQLSDGSPGVSAAETPALPTHVDLTIRGLAQLFGKQPSTVRAWVERGDFPGAYKLQGKEWRVPVSAVEAFQDRQRGRAKSQPRLSAWRSIRATRQASGSETGLKPATTRSPRGNAEASTRVAKDPGTPSTREPGTREPYGHAAPAGVLTPGNRTQGRSFRAHGAATPRASPPGWNSPRSPSALTSWLPAGD